MTEILFFEKRQIAKMQAIYIKMSAARWDNPVHRAADLRKRERIYLKAFYRSKSIIR